MTDPTYTPVIALDYDGTIVDNAWPEHGTPQKDAAAVIKRLRAKGIDFTIHTCRISPFDMEMQRRPGVSVTKEVRAIDRKLKMMGLGYMNIHQDPWKPGAAVYLDDNGAHHDGDWLRSEQIILDRLRQKGFDV